MHIHIHIHIHMHVHRINMMAGFQAANTQGSAVPVEQQLEQVLGMVQAAKQQSGSIAALGTRSVRIHTYHSTHMYVCACGCTAT